MKPNKQPILFILVCILASLLAPTTASATTMTPPDPEVIVLNRSGQAASAIHDGDTLVLMLNGALQTANPQQVSFSLDDGTPAGACTIEPKTNSCQTEPFPAFGWYWRTNGTAAPQRQVSAIIAGIAAPARPVDLTVQPRPIVLVHGFLSTYEGWANYLGPNGFAAQQGLQAFAVGDGQVPGVMSTGSITNPRTRTNTIADNAVILGQYIAGVQAKTGAEMVDLVGHSMGGMISRAYIDSVMQTRNVAQLIMLGSPMGGSDCANLPASLGFYVPASFEIRPSYMRSIFNLQITHRKGVPFHDLAGTPILEGFKSPCTAVPSDLVVSLDSINAIPLAATESPVLHIDMNTSPEVFKDYVLPLLKQTFGKIKDEPDAAVSGQAAPLEQFTRMFSGNVAQGASQELTINIDPGVTVASFALFDNTRSLNVMVHGASGNEIQLSAEKNGLVIVDDPSMMFYLGYGFNNPKPGAWLVTLSATDKTPIEGANFALTARFAGGPTMDARVEPLLPSLGENILISASINDNGQKLPLKAGTASISDSYGYTLLSSLDIKGDTAIMDWKTVLEGDFFVTITLEAEGADGRPVERSAFLAFKVQPANPFKNTAYWAIAVILVCLAALVLIGAAWLFIRRREQIKANPAAAKTGRQK